MAKIEPLTTDPNFNPDTATIGEVLSIGGSPDGVPVSAYLWRDLTPRGGMAMDLIGRLQDRETHQRAVAGAKALVKAAKKRAAELDDRVGAGIEALRKLDKGTELEDKE